MYSYAGRPAHNRAMWALRPRRLVVAALLLLCLAGLARNAQRQPSAPHVRLAGPPPREPASTLPDAPLRAAVAVPTPPLRRKQSPPPPPPPPPPPKSTPPPPTACAPGSALHDRCQSCRTGDPGDGGVRVVGICRSHCSKGGYCGTGDDYVFQGMDCTPCADGARQGGGPAAPAAAAAAAAAREPAPRPLELATDRSEAVCFGPPTARPSRTRR